MWLASRYVYWPSPVGVVTMNSSGWPSMVAIFIRMRRMWVRSVAWDPCVGVSPEQIHEPPALDRATRAIQRQERVGLQRDAYAVTAEPERALQELYIDHQFSLCAHWYAQ